MIRVAALAVTALPSALGGSLRANENLDIARNDVSQSLASELGCFTDSASRVMGKVQKGVSNLSQGVCEDICEDYPYYGLQFGNECWCGDYETDVDKYGSSSDCNMACAGDSGSNCGGRYAMRTFTQAETDDDSIGCFKDSRSRIFTDKWTSSSMTPAKCGTYCADLGRAYYGTQWGGECWCGAAGADYDQYGSGACERPCSGDPTKFCGGSYAMTVYEVDASSSYPCYGDVVASRVGFHQIKDVGGMTHEICKEHCDGYGAAWALPQFGHECFCGYVDTDIDQYGSSSACTMACEGDSSQICGGRSAFNAIELEGTNTEPPSPTPPSPSPPSPATCPDPIMPVPAPTPVMPIPACDSLSAIRWASGTGPGGRMYLEGGGCGTMTDLFDARKETDGRPKGPIYMLDSSNNKILTASEPTGKWLIEAELHVRTGSVFYCVGTGSGGDCDELRIESTDDKFHEIRGHGGSLYFKNTLVTSWDTDAGTPRYEYEGGRSFLNCVSEYESSETCEGQPKNDYGECRMDIIDSEMGWMGYFDSESYGLTWKVRGFCVDKSNPEVFDTTNVYGDIINSDIHHMYYGMYSYGHQGGIWRNNKMRDNYQYGFDPHDDSDYLSIYENEVYNNVNHGIIASKRCNNVKIYDNEVYDGGAQAAGIFLHRSSDRAEVYNNYVHDMQDAGLAILESFDAQIYDNKFENVKYGIRISLGGGNNCVYDNIFDNCSKYGLYTYMGSDAPEQTSDGRPSDNLFLNNDITDTEVGCKIKEGDDTIISGNLFTGTEKLEFNDASGTVFEGNTVPSDACYDNNAESTFASTEELPEEC